MCESLPHSWQSFNPFCPRVLDPGNYPQLYFGFLGVFLCPLVSMLNYVLNKGVIIDHVAKFFWQNLENSLIYGVFRSQGKKMKIFENVFLELKNLTSRSNLNRLSSSHILRVEKDSAIKKLCHISNAGMVIFGDTALQGAKMGLPPKLF